MYHKERVTVNFNKICEFCGNQNMFKDIRHRKEGKRDTIRSDRRTRIITMCMHWYHYFKLEILDLVFKMDIYHSRRLFAGFVFSAIK